MNKQCINCRHFMFSDCYGECNLFVKIVSVTDICERWESECDKMNLDYMRGRNEGYDEGYNKGYEVGCAKSDESYRQGKNDVISILMMLVGASYNTEDCRKLVVDLLDSLK